MKCSESILPIFRYFCSDIHLQKQNGFYDLYGMAIGRSRDRSARSFFGRPALKRYEQTESGLKNEIEAKNGQLFELNRQVAELHPYATTLIQIN